jgi:hypothetical protein
MCLSLPKSSEYKKSKHFYQIKRDPDQVDSISTMNSNERNNYSDRFQRIKMNNNREKVRLIRGKKFKIINL